MTRWYTEAGLPAPFCSNCGSRINFLAVESDRFDSSTGIRLFYLLYWCPSVPTGWKRLFSDCKEKTVYGSGYSGDWWDFEFAPGQINRWFYLPPGAEFMRRVDDV